MEYTEQEWQDIFTEFNNKIKNNINKDSFNIINPRFSTTNSLEQTVAQITVMNSMKQYFTYTVFCGCGIPKVIMEGNLDDWNMLYDKSKQLIEKFEMHFWGEMVLPVIGEFINTYQGKVNTKFWDCCCRSIPTEASGYFSNTDIFLRVKG